MFSVVLPLTSGRRKRLGETKFAKPDEIVDSTQSSEYKGAAFVAL